MGLVRNPDLGTPTIPSNLEIYGINFIVANNPLKSLFVTNLFAIFFDFDVDIPFCFI